MAEAEREHPVIKPDGHQVLITTEQLICLTRSSSATLHPITIISTTKFAQQHSTLDSHQELRFCHSQYTKACPTQSGAER